MSVENKNSTRYFSNLQEQNVCKALGAVQTSNSGAGKFQKSDVIQKDASLSIECKTCISNKDSFSIKKEWLQKAYKESKDMRLDNYCLCFNFGPDSDNFYVVNEKLMKYLVDSLSDFYKEIE